MKVALLTTDNREHLKEYRMATPYFGTAPEALLQGFAHHPDIEVHVVSCTQQPMTSPEKLADNIWFHSLHVPKIGWLKTFYQGCVRAVRRRLRDIAPDIVHGQGTERDCAISAVLSGLPNVITIHGNMAELARQFGARIGSYEWISARLENFALPRTGGVFCNSEYTEQLVDGRARKTWRVPNAIREQFLNSNETEPRPRTSCVILCLGSVMPRKRQLELLDLADRLHSAGCRFEMRFAGPANPNSVYAAEFLARVNDTSRRGYVRYAGEVVGPDLISLFDHAGALVHFPSEEAFGLVVAEALARNVKVFAARVGGIVDVTAGTDAELFAPNDWKKLENALSQWIQAECRRSMTGREIISKRYSPASVAQRHIAIYREVLALNTA